MEREIFKWDGWEDLGIMCNQYYDCTILKDFGPLRKGQKWPTIEVNCEKGYIHVYDVDDTIKHKIKIIFAVA